MKYAKIYKSYIQQNFSLPSPIIRYIANYHSTNSYKKLIQSCKCFFAKNPIFPLTCLHFAPHNYKNCRTCKSEKCKTSLERKIKFHKISIKFLITDSLYIDSNFQFRIASSLIPKLYQCLVTTLEMNRQKITFNEFLFLTPAVKKLYFYRVTIKYGNDGNIVPFEKIFEKLPNLEIFLYFFNDFALEISIETVRNLLKMDHLKNLISISWHNISEKFDLQLFSNFIEENRKINYCLEFYHTLSKEFQNLLSQISKKLITTTPEGFPKPIIC